MSVTLEIPNLPMTVEEFEALPEMEGVRFELVEGNLLVMSAAYVPWHGKMIVDVITWFQRQGRRAYAKCGIRAGKNRRTCDVGVFHHAPALHGASTHDAARFATVVEVVSEESYDRDHVHNPLDYASAGVPEYWIVDQHPEDDSDGTISMFQLELTDDGHRYQLRQRATVKELTARNT